MVSALLLDPLSAKVTAASLGVRAGTGIGAGRIRGFGTSHYLPQRLVGRSRNNSRARLVDHIDGVLDMPRAPPLKSP